MTDTYLVVLRAANTGEVGLPWGAPQSNRETAEALAEEMNSNWPGTRPVFFVVEAAKSV